LTEEMCSYKEYSTNTTKQHANPRSTNPYYKLNNDMYDCMTTVIPPIPTRFCYGLKNICMYHTDKIGCQLSWTK